MSVRYKRLKLIQLFYGSVQIKVVLLFVYIVYNVVLLCLVVSVVNLV